MRRRHLTRNEIIKQCNMIARERRMANRTPWTAMGIMCSYVLLKNEGFKAQRILKVTDKIREFEEQWEKGELILEEVSKELYNKAEWTVEYVKYEKSDITAKKGTYQYFIDERQLEPQNTINEQSTRYMLFFFKALSELYGYGKDRLTRVEQALLDLMEDYRQDKTSIKHWKKKLYEEAGVIFEMPVDPLTQKSGSVMTGL